MEDRELEAVLLRDALVLDLDDLAHQRSGLELDPERDPFLVVDAGTDLAGHRNATGAFLADADERDARLREPIDRDGPGGHRLHDGAARLNRGTAVRDAGRRAQMTLDV